MSAVTPRFLYFDVGNVLLNFDRHRAARQMAEAAGIAPQRVWEIVYDTDLQIRYERGEISSQEFYELFCDEAGSQPDYRELRRASADIFDINVRIVPVVAHLKTAGQRLGILSNTNEAHWSFIISGRYTVIRDYFQQYALSYQIGAMKPEPRIYRVAAQLAGVAPEEVFFVDDREENVAAARQVGFDAVQYTDALQLANELRGRGIRFNC